MSDWSYWLIGAGILVVAELFIGTFYLLMIALGLLAGALAAWLGAAGPLQTLCAAALGVLATVLLRRSRFARARQGQAANDPDVNLDIGARVSVAQWHERRARVMYRGALWDVELQAGLEPAPGDYRVAAVRGSVLVLARP